MTISFLFNHFSLSSPQEPHQESLDVTPPELWLICYSICFVCHFYTHSLMFCNKMFPSQTVLLGSCSAESVHHTLYKSCLVIRQVRKLYFPELQQVKQGSLVNVKRCLDLCWFICRSASEVHLCIHCAFNLKTVNRKCCRSLQDTEANVA